jgi:hypothetical protein
VTQRLIEIAATTGWRLLAFQYNVGDDEGERKARKGLGQSPLRPAPRSVVGGFGNQ